MARKQAWPPANRPEETWVPGPALPSLTSRLVFHSFPRSAKGELKHMVHEFPYSSNCPRFSLLILSKQPERPLDTVQAGIQLGEGKETPGCLSSCGTEDSRMRWTRKTLVTCYCHPRCHGATVAVQFIAAGTQQWGKEKNDLAYNLPHPPILNSGTPD